MIRKLEEYNRKRDFTKTAEPAGEKEETADKLRFVIQYHAATRTHYDFRLEWEGVLLSWVIPKGPSFNTRDKRLAVEVEDHPLEYRNFEGIIPKPEYGGGVVMLWDEGYWEPRVDVAKGLRDGALKFVLRGHRLKGKWALHRMKSGSAEERKNWLLVKEKDEYTMDNDGISTNDTSVRTGRTMKEIEGDKSVEHKKLPFERTGVQLAKLVDKAPEGEGWFFELKYDGYRILAFLDGGDVRLMSRNGHDYTGKFQDIADALRQWANGRSVVLDGEVVIFGGEGGTDFQALQNYLKNPGDKNLTYVVFDLLALAGADLRKKSLRDRKEILEPLLADAPENLHYSRHTSGNGKEIYRAACRAKMEGIIGKRADSVYSGTRNNDWLKIKCENRQEFVVGGYTLTDKKNSGVSALLLGVYEGKDLVYAGRAGTGFTGKTMQELEEKFAKLQRKTPPFKNAPEQRRSETITWLSPILVAEVRFAEWTDEDLLRQASFKGLRTDKEAGDVKREYRERTAAAEGKLKDLNPTQEGNAKQETNRKNIKVNGVSLSSPDKEMFEGFGITKEDVARYYAEVSGRMLPFVRERVLSFVRCSDGIGEECFYQKHLQQIPRGMGKIPVREKSGKTKDYFYIEDVYGLIAAVQISTLEFHVWGSRIDQLEKPDIMVFDLDPEEGMDQEKLRAGVRDMKKVLDELSLESYLKTSGGKGYHVLVALEPSAGWDAVRKFAKLTAVAMGKRWPATATPPT